MGHTGPTSSGSGFVVTSDGMILTNAHVVADAVKVEVKLPNGNKYKGVVVDIDPLTDLAAVQLIDVGKVCGQNGLLINKFSVKAKANEY